MVKKPMSLAINTTPAPPASGITVSETGSLRGDGISVSMAGLRIADSVGGAPAPSAAAGSSSAGEGGSAWLSEMDVEHVLGEGSSGVVKLVRHRKQRDHSHIGA